MGEGGPVLSDQAAARVLDYLGFSWDDCEQLEHGFYGWTMSARFADCATIAWGGQGGTVWVSFPASSLAWLEEHGFSWRLVVCKVARLGAGASFRRVDFAFDDRGGPGVIDLDAIVLAVKAGQLVSHFKEVTLTKSLTGAGWTVYMGARESANFIRFYDKAAEQQSKGYEYAGHWIRCEIEVKGDRADAVMRGWLASQFGSEFPLSYLLQVVDFRDTDDSNTTRRSRLDWWEAFVGMVKAARVRIAAKVKDLRSTVAWLVRQVSTSLAVVDYVTHGQGIQALLLDGYERWGDKQEQMARWELALQDAIENPTGEFNFA
jgi:DNA relaxase NicK